jgi:hypothetical protein
MRPSHLQKKRLPQLIWRMGKSYFPDTKKSVIPKNPSWASMLIALSTAPWKGGITGHVKERGGCEEGRAGVPCRHVPASVHVCVVTHWRASRRR